MKIMHTRKQNLLSNLKAIVGNTFFVNAFAEETPQGNDTSTPPALNYEQLISQARKEEKDKLYPQIEKYKAQIEVLTKQSNEALLAKGQLELELAELKKAREKGDSEEVIKLKASVEALTQENEKLKKEAPNEEDIRKKLEAEYEVKLYIKDKLTENKDKILSVFADKVSGNTKEEVDEAIKKAIESSDAIRKELGVDDSKKKSNKGDKKDEPKGNNNPPAPNPSNDNGSDRFNLEEISKLDPRSKEYAEWRKSVGLK